MMNRENISIFWIGAMICLLALMSAVEIQSQKSKTDEPQTPQTAQDVRLRGTAVCLAEEMHALYQSDLSSNHEHLYGFKTTEGGYYTLLRTRLSEALFIDKRLHEKELILHGRTFPKTQILESISLQSVHNGVVHDLYYYCQTCDIRAIAPGDCVCCQAPVELVEKPLKGDGTTAR